jgi:hypothetical protein
MSFFPSQIIKWITWEEISHVALMFPEERGVVWEAWNEGGVRTTASLSDQHTAGTEVVVKYIDVSQGQYDRILQAVVSQKGKPYDWKGCLRFSPVFRLFMSSVPDYEVQDRWFCSCLLSWCLRQGFIVLQDEAPNKMSPGNVMESPVPKYVDTFFCGVSDYAELLKKVRDAR